MNFSIFQAHNTQSDQMESEFKQTVLRTHINKLNSVCRIAIHKRMPKHSTKTEYKETKHRARQVHRNKERTVRFHNQTVDQKRKHLKDRTDFKALHHLVIHRHRTSDMVEIQAHRHHRARDRVHSEVKHSAIADHSINRHLAAATAVLARKQTRLAVPIISDQILVQMPAAIHTIDRTNSFSRAIK